MNENYCYYCLKSFHSLSTLTRHLSSHIHYTNTSIINCTILVLDEPGWRKGFVDGLSQDDSGNILHTIQFKSKKASLNLANIPFCIHSKPLSYETDMNISGDEVIYGQNLTKVYFLIQSNASYQRNL